ncbi:MAG: ABC transporter permease [Candidatus Omnitrophica bacterium]|nr:ABC transporter permease [Candidatus Omnitrophota bacterium]MCM8826032.1 ABC transporter permease [Candidatus Omnitrophota bacterium]
MILEFHLAKRYLFRGRAKHISFISVVACLGITLGIATLIIVISVMNGFDRDLMDKLLKFNYHLTLESTDYNKLARIREIVKGWGEVSNVSIFATTQVFVNLDNYIFPVRVIGIDFDDSKEKEEFTKYIVEDRGGEGVFVGEGLRRRIEFDDNIELYPLGRVLDLVRERVRGYFKVGLYEADTCLVTDWQKVRSYSSTYSLSLGIRLHNPFEAKIIKERLNDMFKDEFFITTWIDSNRALFSALKLEKLAMFILLSLITVVASFAIFSILTVKVVEKTKDIGILKSLGFTNKRVLTIFSLQGILLGLIGVFLGVILGLGLCFILKKYPFIRIPEEFYYTEYLPVFVDYGDTFLIVILGFFLSVISSFFPALRAARLPVSEALRYE